MDRLYQSLGSVFYIIIGLKTLLCSIFTDNFLSWNSGCFLSTCWALQLQNSKMKVISPRAPKSTVTSKTHLKLLHPHLQTKKNLLRPPSPQVQSPPPPPDKRTNAVSPTFRKSLKHLEKSKAPLRQGLSSGLFVELRKSLLPNTLEHKSVSGAERTFLCGNTWPTWMRTLPATFIEKSTDYRHLVLTSVLKRLRRKSVLNSEKRRRSEPCRSK